jgi:hypothetical protein
MRRDDGAEDVINQHVTICRLLATRHPLAENIEYWYYIQYSQHSTHLSTVNTLLAPLRAQQL